MNKIRLGYNAVPDNAKRLIDEVWKSGQFSPGAKVKEFEEVWAKAHLAKHAVFVNSGTDALRLSLLAMKEKYKWRDGDEVAVPALTFVATVNTILQAGLSPFFVDVGMYDYCINPSNFERRAQGTHTRLVAMMPVHLFGQSCSQEVFDIAKKYKLRVIEDSCEIVLNPVKGDVSCHSTYMAHHVTTGVGGFAVTNDESLMLLIRSYGNHGRNVSYLPGFTTATRAINKRFQFDRIGYSSRGTEFEAALGLSQMSGLEHSVFMRRHVAAALLHALEDVEGLVFPKPRDWDGGSHTWMMFPIVIEETSRIRKYDLCLHLEKSGIETRDMMPITNQRCYKGLVNEDDFPVAKWINKNGFYIPCHPGMGKEDVKQIKKAFDSYLTKK